MAEVTWASFLPIAIPSLPNCPQFSIESELAAAASEFCGRSRVWRTETPVQVATIANIAQYSPALPGLIERIWSIKFQNGQALIPIRRGISDPSIYSSPGTPAEYALVNDSSLIIYPTPDAAYTLEMTCCMKPDRGSATGVESFIYQSYADVIASGAIYKLALIPGKPWTNPELAAYHKQNFDSGIDRAIARDMRGVSPRSRPAFF